MRINTNVASLTALEANKNTNANLGKSLEKLSSGLRINKASDDASGLAIADKLRTQASSLAQGISNANSGAALIQIADKAMAEQSNILDTVKAKLIQAATSTTSVDGKEAIRKDITKLLEQFDSIAAQTNYNGTTLLQRSSTDTAKTDNFSFQLGETKEYSVASKPSNPSNTTALGGGTAAFGASSINTSVGAGDIRGANTVNGTQYGTGNVSDNNIGSFGAQQINTSGAVTITTVSMSTNGVNEKVSGLKIDMTVSGNIGILVGAGDITLDISSETQEVKDQVQAMVQADPANLGFNAAGEVSLDGTSIDFSKIDFSALQIKAGTADETIILNKGNSVETKTFSVTNNYGQSEVDGGELRSDVDTSLGHLNVVATSGANMTGGPLMSELKDLQYGELTVSVANSFMTTVDAALTQVNTLRSDFGSTQNQLESSIRNMQTTQTNLKAAESVIRDVDYAAESANFNKTNIIAQAGTYAISQANNVQQNVMKLLQ